MVRLEGPEGIAIELADLKRVDRVVGIAGGRRKFAAIRGALRGRRINVLITDRSTGADYSSTHQP